MAHHAGPLNLAPIASRQLDLPLLTSTGAIVQIHPLDPIGAEIEGVDLAALGDHDFRDIHQALLHHGVLVFRDQRITPDEHTVFGR